MNTKLRPPAVPLVTVDPYFSVWSMADRLHDDDTRHWTGQRHGMVGMISIDGQPWIFMGKISSDHSKIQAMVQKELIVKPLSSIYTFEGGGIRLEVNFTTPLLLDDLEVLSRPLSYITFNVSSLDGEKHDVQIYFDVTGEWCVNSPDQKLVWRRENIGDEMEAMVMGSEEQPILGRAGDNVRIDWGYFYLVVPKNQEVQNVKTVIHSSKVRDEFIRMMDIPCRDDEEMPREAGETPPVMAALIDLGTVGEKAFSYHLMLAYDDVYSIEYFGKPLLAYWRRNGLTMEEMIRRSEAEYRDLMARCEDFNQSLTTEGIRTGGEKYADILALAYRQAIAAHKLVVGEKGEILFFSKECFSNGCIATVDVSYPSSPLFLLYNTELLKGMLRPVFRFAESDQWRFDFSPHDVGCYPKANGQVYGAETEENFIKNQMPIEECGNMLIMTAALCLADKNTDFARENWTTLTKWANYLVQNGLDPENQLCTDDFAGHLAHNTNLSIKAILGIASYSIMQRMSGDSDEAEHYLEIAKEMAVKWEQMARADDHYKLTFDSSNASWSQKYNIIWDGLFKLNIFPAEIIQKEVPYYIGNQNRYGIPLDNRKTYTKADWIVWSASLAQSDDDFRALIDPLWGFLNESEDRVPFSDWYDTMSAKVMNFRHRSVVGGMFIKLLKERALVW